MAPYVETYKTPVKSYLEFSEDETEVRLRFEVPGRKASDLEVSVLDDTLTVRGSWARSTFRESLRISDKYDLEGIHAHLEDGILTVTVPKVPKAQPRRIPITNPRDLT